LLAETIDLVGTQRIETAILSQLRSRRTEVRQSIGEETDDPRELEDVPCPDVCRAQES
jgi:hypothetical protein